MINERIKEVRTRLGFNQKKFAGELGLSDSTRLSDIERGKIKPSVNILEIIIEKFNIDSNWLITGKGEMSGKTKIHNFDDYKEKDNYDFSSQTETVTIPIMGEISAGLPVAVMDNEPIETITVDKYLIDNRDQYIGLRVNGDSMEPDIKNGDMLLIRKDCTWEEAMQQIVAVRVEGEITLKRLHLDDKNEMIVLYSTNQSYAPIIIDPEHVKDIQLVGKLAYLFRKY